MARRPTARQNANQSDDLHRLGLMLKFIYSIVGLLLGLACVIVGLVLGLYGVVGHTTLAASVLGLSTNVTDAAPGVVVFVVGFIADLRRGVGRRHRGGSGGRQDRPGP